MANSPTVKIGNTTYKNQQILEVSFSVSTPYSSANGERHGSPAHGTINILKRLDESDNVWEFAQEKSKSKRFDGEIAFIRDDDNTHTIKKLVWKDGFITHYEIRIPNIEGSGPTTEFLCISAREVTVGKVTSKMNWAEKPE